MKKFFALLVMVLTVSLALSADIYIKSTMHQDAMAVMGQNTPARDDTAESWIGDDKFAMISGAQSFIMDLKKNVMYIVNPKNKSYVEATLPLDFSKLLPPEAAAMAGMFKMTATVKPTGETKTVGQWNCTGYDVTLSVMGMPMNMKVWASTDVPFDFNAFNAKIYGNLLKGQMRLDDASVQEMMKIKGYQIASETSMDMMGMKMHMTSEVLEIGKKTPPANIYAPPSDYTKKDTLSLDEIKR
jgi:hypothetical protein